ncbi:MAG: hypothetical protein M1839_008930 [Geoglossum umbratile]|nr:MAG: hypothetical protein M1839_008930 [Geoglossum umbratile]
MLVAYAYVLALLPVLSLAQVYTITVGGHVTSITLPPWVIPTTTAAATATSTSTASAATSATTTTTLHTSVVSTSTVTTVAGGIVPTTPTNNGTATATATTNPFLGAASNMKGSGLAVTLAGFAVIAMLYG